MDTTKVIATREMRGDAKRGGREHGEGSLRSKLQYKKHIHCGRPLSGHSQQRPPSLMWPQIFAAATMATMNVFTSLSRQRPPL